MSEGDDVSARDALAIAQRVLARVNEFEERIDQLEAQRGGLQEDLTAVKLRLSEINAAFSTDAIFTERDQLQAAVDDVDERVGVDLEAAADALPEKTGLQLNTRTLVGTIDAPPAEVREELRSMSRVYPNTLASIQFDINEATGERIWEVGSYTYRPEGWFGGWQYHVRLTPRGSTQLRATGITKYDA